jgi:hypothetical protein
MTSYTPGGLHVTSCFTTSWGAAHHGGVERDKQLHHNDADGVDVDPVVVHVPRQLLWCAVTGGAHLSRVLTPVRTQALHSLCTGAAACGAAPIGQGERGQAEVADLDAGVVAPTIQDDVRGLDVSMDDALAVHVAQTEKQLVEDGNVEVVIDSVLLLDPLVQRRPTTKLHGDVERVGELGQLERVSVSVRDDRFGVGRRGAGGGGGYRVRIVRAALAGVSPRPTGECPRVLGRCGYLVKATSSAVCSDRKRSVWL